MPFPFPILQVRVRGLYAGGLDVRSAWRETMTLRVVRTSGGRREGGLRLKSLILPGLRRGWAKYDWLFCE